MSNLDETFNIEPVISAIVPDNEEGEIVIAQSTELSHQLDDTKQLKKSIKKTLKKAHDALDIIMTEQATMPANTKSTEALAKLIDSIAKLTQVSLDLNTREKEFEFKLKEKSSAQKVVNNNTLNIMGTSEVIEKILNRKKELTNDRS